MSIFRTTIFTWVAAIASFGASGVYASCALPAEIELPDGATATTEEIRAGRAAVQLFMSDMDAYLECLNQDNQVKANSPNYSPEDDAAHTDLYNSGVDIMEAIAGRFNEQLTIFKSQKDAAVLTDTTP